MEVVHLLNHMTQNHLSVNTMFKQISQKSLTADSLINEATFDECCQESRYEPSNRAKLIQHLSDRN